MNSWQRVMNTIHGLPVDRVPVFAVLCAYGGKLTRTDLRTLYRDAAAYVAGQVAVQEKFGLDIVLAPFDYGAVVQAFGGEVAWFADQPPNLKKPAAANAAAALALPQPDFRQAEGLSVILAAARQLSGRYREEVPVYAVVPGPCSLPALVTGLEQWMEALLFDTATAQKLLERCGLFFLAWSQALLETGVTGLIVTEGLATAEMVPRDLFQSRLLPHLQAMFSQVTGPLVFHHGGGCIGHILDLLAGLPNLCGVTISSKDDLARARGMLGPDLLLLGNLDNLGFPGASAGEIRARSLTCLQTAAPAGRYILAHSAADIPLNTPPENLRAMLAASADYAADPRSAS